MNIHKNARLTPHGRALLVTRMLDGGLRPEEAAQASGVSVRTAYKWLQRFRTEGLAGLNDRSSRPKTCPHALPAAVLAEVIEQRRSRQTYRQVSEHCRVAQSTIGRWLQRAGLNRLASLEPAAPHRALRVPRTRRHAPSRYQKARALSASRTSGDCRPHTELAEGGLGIRPCRHRRRFSPGLRQHSGRRKWPQRMPGIALGTALLPTVRHYLPACPYR